MRSAGNSFSKEQQGESGPRSKKIAPEGKDRRYVTALARGLNILRCFDADHTELGSVELAKMTGLPQSTVWRLCYTLVQHGFLVPCEKNDKLQIGTPVLSLGYSALSVLGFDDNLRREMREVAVDFDAAVSIASPDQEDMIINQRARGNGVLLVNLSVGSRLPIVRSAFGWGYLALLSEQKRLEVLERLIPESHPDKIFLLDNIRNAIAEYQRHGYVINTGVFHKNINAIAIPFQDPRGSTIHVINCGAPAQTLSVKCMREQVAPRLMALVKTARISQMAKMSNN